MKKLLKWVAWVLAGLLGLLALAVVAIYVLSAYKLSRTFEVPVQGFTVPADSAAIVAGERLARVYGCRGCHQSDLSGLVLMEHPLLGRIVSPNLTRSRENYSDDELIRVLRHGVRSDGKSVLPAMPAEAFSRISDEDLGAIIAYVRNEPPVEDSLPATEVGLLMRVALTLAGIPLPPDVIDHERRPPVRIDRGDLQAFGRYLAFTGCSECHGPDVRGNDKFLITPDLAVTSSYTLEQFHTFMRTGVALGGRELPMMSSVARARFAHFTDDEVSALHAYLTTLVDIPPDE